MIIYSANKLQHEIGAGHDPEGGGGTTQERNIKATATSWIIATDFNKLGFTVSMASASIAL
jgi:hypothetical protein